MGPRGRIIGVDLTDAMLAEAHARIESHGWSNVELVKSDASLYVFPPALEGILSTFALTLVPDFEEVVQKGAASLLPGKRFVLLDFKMPSGWLMTKAAPLLAALLTAPFGGTIKMASRKPWQSLAKHLSLTQFTNLYFGGAYIAVGEKARVSPSGTAKKDLPYDEPRRIDGRMGDYAGQDIYGQNLELSGSVHQGRAATFIGKCRIVVRAQKYKGVKCLMV